MVSQTTMHIVPKARPSRARSTSSVVLGTPCTTLAYPPTRRYRTRARAIHGLADSVEASAGLGAVEDFGDADVLLEDEGEHAVVANVHALEGRIVVAPHGADVRARPGSAGSLRRGTSPAGPVLRIR